ncbi:MAG: aminopeptidase P family protein [Clostridia bacterium]|nr:aminopeptidase P family protein [Clostridia bacterium]
MTKLQKLIAGMGEKADGILITSQINQLYITDFDFSDGYVLVTKEKSYLITDFRYIEAAKNQAAQGFTVLMFKGLNDGTLQSLLKENNVNRLMFEDRELTCSDYVKIKKLFAETELVPAGDLIDRIREFKTDTEAEYTIKAQRIAEKSLSMLIENFDRNMTEKELAAYLEYLMKKNKADGISFSTIAVSGKASSLPHGVPRDTKLENGFLTIDFGAVYKGYHSDMTRTFVIGKADDEMKKVYDTVLNAQRLAIEAIENGERNCFEIDKIARDYIYSSGYEGCFGHGLGHGTGLQIHESPRLSPSAPKSKLLENGHIVTVEPGIYLENKYGVRIEDMIYMSEKGPVNITKMPKNLIEL